MSSLGIIEVVGMTAAVEALDSMLKTSEVEFVTAEKTLGGRLVTVVVKGDVSSVTAAVENAREAVQGVNNVVASAVIPNPHKEVMKIVNLSAKKYEKN